MTDIGAFEAKTQFSRLLQRARKGEAFTITHRGVPIAKLVPTDRAIDESAVRAAFRRLREGAKGIASPPITADEIIEWKNTGRR